MFKNAIVRMPCPEMIFGLTSSALGKPDYGIALDQHSKYVQALVWCGLDVLVLEPDSRFPDSTFVEDVAVCTPECAIISNPGAPERNGEQLEMMEVLKSKYDHVDSIEAPGTLEAGDVMMCGQHYYVGISERTNQDGADQLLGILAGYHLSGQKVRLTKKLHLKSGVSYLEQNNLLVSSDFMNHPAFKDFQRIKVSPDEAYASNSLWINNRVLVPAGFPETREKIEQAGYETISLEVSEFQKLDGGLSCLSLRF